MLHSELDSFILKFKSLWYSGIDAHLDVDTHAGQAWVGLRVGLGHGHPPAVQPHVQRKKESPSRQLRRARRAEARLLAAAVSTTEKVTVRTIVDSDTEKVTSRDDKSEDSTEVTTGREDPSEIDVVEEIAANFSDLNGEVRDEFCTLQMKSMLKTLLVEPLPPPSDSSLKIPLSAKVKKHLKIN